MADAPGLMPCPFCGGEAILSSARFDLEGYTVNCPRHHAGHTCFVEISLWRKTKSEAITAWNTRATPPAVVVEAMERAMRPFAFFNEDNANEDIQTAWETRYRDRFRDWIDFGDIEAVRAALAALTAWKDAQ